MNGAENNQPGEGDFDTRKMYAVQVWHEHLPARVEDNARIYRNFEMDGFVNLMMLDTRIIGRDKQLDYSDYLTADGINSNAFLADWQNSERTILGTEQRAWLASQLAGNTLKWQVLGNQGLMSKIWIPAEMLLLTGQIAAGNTITELIAQYNALVTELVIIIW